MKNRSIFSAIFFLSVIYLSCRKENDNSPVTSSQSKIQATIAGVVLDESNVPVSGVTVKTDEGQTLSDQNGVFIFSNISVDRKRCLVTYEKPGYFTGSKAFIPSQDNLNYTRIILLSKGAGEVISATAGGKVNLANMASVEFQSSSFVDQSGNAYNGSVTVHVKHLSPDDADFGFSFPGGDLAARDQSGKEVVLYSFGMMGVELKGSGGAPLQLAPGKKATLTFPIADSQLASAPASIPLWYYDENEMLWKQEGVAVKTAKEYIGTVSHFTWWNCDICSSSATISGSVVDCQNNPVPNVIVTVNSYYTTTTNQSGNYSGIVPSGISLSFQVLSASNSGLFSQVENISPLTSGQTVVVPDLIIQCPAHITGTLIGCSNQPVNGIVAVYNQSQLLNYTFSSGGTFDIIVPANSTITLLSTVNSINQSNTILSPNNGVTTSAGIIQLCGNNIPTDNSFILNGDGYNNELIAIDSLMMSEANYQINSQNTSCNNLGTGFSGPVYLDLYFPGNATGTFTLPGTPGYVDGYIVIVDQNKQYQGSNSGTNNQLSITVTEYGAVGEKIKGIFSGSLSRWDGNNWVYVNISNGKFSYTRGPDL